MEFLGTHTLTAQSLNLHSHRLVMDVAKSVHEGQSTQDDRVRTTSRTWPNELEIIAQTGDEWSTTGTLVHIGNPGYQDIRSSGFPFVEIANSSSRHTGVRLIRKPDP